MDYIKRAFLYLRRKIGKSLLLILVTTTSLIVMMTGLTIQNAVLQSSENNKKPLGNMVILSTRQQQLGQKVITNSFNSRNFWSYPLAGVNQSMINEKIVQRLARLSGVASYQVHSRAQVQAASFHLPSSESGLREQTAAKVSPKHNQVTVFGLSTNLDDPNFRNRRYSITKGRAISHSDLGSRHVVIEKTLALADNIDVGDTLKVRSINKRVTNLRVVGIYSAQDSAGHVFSAFEDPARTVFASYSLASSLAGKGGKVLQAAYTFSDAHRERSFIQKANRLISAPLQLTSVNRLYSSLTLWVRTLMLLALRLIWSAVLVGTIILFIILSTAASSRKKEVHLLMALGESRGKIIGQFFVETGLIFLVSLLLTSIFGNFFSSLLGERLIAETTIFAIPLGAGDIFALFILGLLMTALATGLSVIPLFRFKDKKLLF